MLDKLYTLNKVAMKILDKLVTELLSSRYLTIYPCQRAEFFEPSQLITNIGVRVCWQSVSLWSVVVNANFWPVFIVIKIELSILVMLIIYIMLLCGL